MIGAIIVALCLIALCRIVQKSPTERKPVNFNVLIARDRIYHEVKRM